MAELAYIQTFERWILQNCSNKLQDFRQTVDTKSLKLGIEYRWPSDYNNTHLSRDILCFFVFARLNKFRFGEVSTALPDVTDHVSSVSASQIQYHYVYVSFKRLPAEKKNVKKKKKKERNRNTDPNQNTTACVQCMFWTDGTRMKTTSKLKTFCYMPTASQSLTVYVGYLIGGWGCSSAGTASDRRVADVGSIPRCGTGLFSQSQLSVQTLLRCPYAPMCKHMH